MSYTQLTREQRYQIKALLDTGHSRTEIAQQLEVNKSTVSREVRRNRGRRGYRPKQAHEMALKFERKEVKKTYFAIVQGIPGEGVFDRKVLVKKKTKFKKPAVTNFKTIKSIQTNISYKEKENVMLSLVEIDLDTGRWHQIRQHFAQHHFDIC